MITLLSPNYVPQPVTQDDLIIASICWGFTLGFGFLTVWAAVKQTTMARKMRRSRLTSPYIVMIWGEIFVCLGFSIICWLHLRGVIPPSFAFYFFILTLWALQVQFLLQIIINRILIILMDRDKGYKIRFAVAVLITAINISVYCIWVPARLQISERYIHINDIWDRCEKAIYLCVDGLLNLYFIRTVQLNLTTQGLKKYESLVTFNIYLIFFSLAMDVLIISMMSLKNSFVYMQFHPLAYIVKLKIEMSMADLIATVARIRLHHKPNGLNKMDVFKNDLTFPAAPNNPLHDRDISLKKLDSRNDSVISIELRDIMNSQASSMAPEAKRAKSLRRSESHSTNTIDDGVPGMRVHTKKEVMVQFESRTPGFLPSEDAGYDDYKPDWAVNTEEDVSSIGTGASRSTGDEGYGSSTKVFSNKGT